MSKVEQNPYKHTKIDKHVGSMSYIRNKALRAGIHHNICDGVEPWLLILSDICSTTLSASHGTLSINILSLCSLKKSYFVSFADKHCFNVDLGLVRLFSFLGTFNICRVGTYSANHSNILPILKSRYTWCVICKSGSKR